MTARQLWWLGWFWAVAAILNLALWAVDLPDPPSDPSDGFSWWSILGGAVIFGLSSAMFLWDSRRKRKQEATEDASALASPETQTVNGREAVRYILIGLTGTLSVGSFVLGLVLGEPLVITGAALLLLAALSLVSNQWFGRSR